jgi:biotin operon repressor
MPQQPVGRPFIQFPVEIIDDESLTGLARLLWAVLERRAARLSGVCDPSLVGLARTLGVSRPTVLKLLAELEAHGLVERRRGQHRNSYQVCQRVERIHALRPVGSRVKPVDSATVNRVDPAAGSTVKPADPAKSVSTRSESTRLTDSDPSRVKPVDPNHIEVPEGYPVSGGRGLNHSGRNTDKGTTVKPECKSPGQAAPASPRPPGRGRETSLRGRA